MVDRTQINSVSDWMRALAQVAREQDYEGWETLKSITANWMQTEEERAAQDELLDEIFDLVDRAQQA